MYTVENYRTVTRTKCCLGVLWVKKLVVSCDPTAADYILGDLIFYVIHF